MNDVYGVNYVGFLWDKVWPMTLHKKYENAKTNKKGPLR